MPITKQRYKEIRRELHDLLSERLNTLSAPEGAAIIKKPDTPSFLFGIAVGMRLTPEESLAIYYQGKEGTVA